jgi:hypothetical protein
MWLFAGFPKTDETVEKDIETKFLATSSDFPNEYSTAYERVS